MTRRYYIAVAFLFLACHAATAQGTPEAASAGVLVYYNEEGIRAPELLPVDFAPLLSSDCKNEADGTVSLSIVVDSGGRSKNIVAQDPFDDDLDHMAAAIATFDRFTPGNKDGNPVAVARNLEISLSVCTAKEIGKNGKASNRLKLNALPVQQLFAAAAQHPPEITVLSSDPLFKSPEHHPAHSHVGGGVSAPIPISTPEPQLTSEERKLKSRGVCLVSIIIDQFGVPQHPRVIRGINQDLDHKAIEAVSKYRFKPAMKGKEPVPVMMTIEVNFQLY